MTDNNDQATTRLADIRADLDDGIDADDAVWLLSLAEQLQGQRDEARAENASLTARVEAFLEPHALVLRTIAWADEDRVLHATEHTVCGHCVPQYSHFSRREDIPEGPCALVQALGVPGDR